jgi:hypothetical protein
MKWVLLVIAAIGSLAALGYVTWQKLSIDTAQPEFVSSFQSNFIGGCVSSAEDSLKAAGKTVDDVMKAKLQQVCTCGAETSVAELQTKDGMTMAEMMDRVNSAGFKERVEAIMQQCQQRAAQ